MRTVWEFELSAESDQEITLPAESDILSIQAQRGRLVLWALVNPEKPSVNRKIFIRGTGQPLTEGEGRYLGTVQLEDGDIVWHVFLSIKEFLKGAL